MAHLIIIYFKYNLGPEGGYKNYLKLWDLVDIGLIC